jgi:PD-(D/E)XK endonuclease
MRSLLYGTGQISRHPVDVGERSEAIILAELIKRGHRVLVPYGTNHRYDLVIDVGKRFLRAQCKTGRVYALDIDEATSSEGALRVDPTANGQAKRIRWAADHALPA